jgi:FHA domain-containing protein
VPGINRDEQDPQKFHVDWQAVHAGLNPWKRSEKVIIDPYLVAKAVKGVMRQCTQQTATGKPLVWNDYAVFMELNDWEQVKKLEATLTRDLGGVVTRTLKKSKAEMVGPLNVRLLRDEGNVVRPNTAVIKVDFRPEEKLDAIGGADASEMTVRIGSLVAKSVTDLTQRVPDMEGLGVQDENAPEQLRVSWPGGTTTVRDGNRIVLGRPHPAPSVGFVPLAGASSKINKRQLWVEADEDGALIGRLSDANPVEVNGRLLQAGGQISIEDFPAQISLSSGELTLTLERIEPS